MKSYLDSLKGLLLLFFFLLVSSLPDPVCMCVPWSGLLHHDAYRYSISFYSCMPSHLDEISVKCGTTASVPTNVEEESPVKGSSDGEDFSLNVSFSRVATLSGNSGSMS